MQENDACCIHFIPRPSPRRSPRQTPAQPHDTTRRITVSENPKRGFEAGRSGWSPAARRVPSAARAAPPPLAPPPAAALPPSASAAHPAHPACSCPPRPPASQPRSTVGVCQGAVPRRRRGRSERRSLAAARPAAHTNQSPCPHREDTKQLRPLAAPPSQPSSEGGLQIHTRLLLLKAGEWVRGCGGGIAPEVVVPLGGCDVGENRRALQRHHRAVEPRTRHHQLILQQRTGNSTLQNTGPGGCGGVVVVGVWRVPGAACLAPAGSMSAAAGALALSGGRTPPRGRGPRSSTAMRCT